MSFYTPASHTVTSNGDDLSEGKKETEKDNFSSFDFNEGIRKVEPALASVRGSSSKSANMRTSRVELISETTLNQLSSSREVLKKMTTHHTDLKREHKLNAKTDLSRTYSKPALHGLSTTSINAKGDRNAKSRASDPSQAIWTKSSTTGIVPEKQIGDHAGCLKEELPLERDDPFINFLIESILEISTELSSKVKEITELLCKR
ncbi:unnamed protein product [Urochloa humidicola]